MQTAEYEIFETKERVLADNVREAGNVRGMLGDTLLVNLMGSPGAGKTSTLLRVIEHLGARYALGVMEADVDSDVDAKTIAATGTRVIQLHTGGLCHMDADMTRRGLERMDVKGLDLVFLENIGNLVCPAEFEVGADLRVMILSVPEGDDKPLKYPLMFQISDCLLVNKMDARPIFDFDLEAMTGRVRKLNPEIQIFPVSAATGEGFEDFTRWLALRAEAKRAERGERG